MFINCETIIKNCGWMSSVKESSDKIRKVAETLKENVRGITGSFAQSVPRPLIDRITQREPLFIKEPLLKLLKKRRR